MLLGLPSTLLLLVGQSAAVHVALEGRYTSPDDRRDAPASRFARRGNIFGQTQLNDSQNLNYFTNITLGSQDFQVIIDTGSSDLWVIGPVNNAKDTGASTSLTYAKGSVSGPIKTAQLNFSDYIIPNQAFLDADASAAKSFPPGQQGILGLGPSNGSSVRANVNSSAGDPALDNIFRQNTSTPNFISFLLGRADVGSHSFPGDLTVGEILPGYEAVTSAPKLPVTTVVNNDTSNQHWSVLLDKDGIIGPDGKVIPFTSNVAGAPDGRATVVIDSGFSLPQVPASVAEAIYSGVSGAQLTNVSSSAQLWIVPCNAELNVSFKFGGTTYPVHPLDTVMHQNTTGVTEAIAGDSCLGSFQPVSFSFGGDTEFDIIFGMAFLRNTYTLINFGDFVDGANGTTADPYIQLLSTTNDTTLAHQEFTAQRSGVSSSTNSARTRAIIIGSIAAGAVLLLLIGCCLLCCRRRRGRGAQAQKGFAMPAMPNMPWGGANYRQLNEPAPAGHDLHVVGQTTGAVPTLGYNDPYAERPHY